MNRMSMMEHVHLAGEDEEDMYSGYDAYNATLDTDVRMWRSVTFLPHKGCRGIVFTHGVRMGGRAGGGK